MFVIAGLIFAATAVTYAEGTVRYPEAGGSSSFARHAFNELVSFGAAWAQMLVYVATVAISAFFVPHYLSVFWEPLRTNPWDIVGGAIVIVLLVGINIVGVKEAASLNILLAVIDFATQALLVIVGFVLVFSPEVLIDNIHLGIAPTWSQFFISIPIAMLAYTGVETVSNLAEEARDPARNVPQAYKLVAGAVFAIYLTLPLIALSALPVYQQTNGDWVTNLGLPPEEGGFTNDPVLGVVKNLGIEQGALLDGLEVYVGVLAATILFIATNAGVIGASRITYAMSGYRQLPLVFRRLHPKFKTPWLALVVFAGIGPILTILPGDVTFLGTMYSFGATLSFTVAHSSIIALRARKPDHEALFFGRPNLRIGTTVTSCGGSATSGAESSGTTTGSRPVPCLPVLSAISCSAQSANPTSPEPWSTSTSLLRSGVVPAIAAPSRSPGLASSSAASRSATLSASSSSARCRHRRARSAPGRTRSAPSSGRRRRGRR